MLPCENKLEAKISPEKTSGPNDPKYPSFLVHLPNTCFGIPMGLAGHAVMWKTACSVDFINERVDTQLASATFWIASLVTIIMSLIAYCAKAVWCFSLVTDEYHDSARVHFFNMPHLILLMLLISFPENLSGFSMRLGDGEMVRGVVFGIILLLQLTITLYIAEQWLFADNIRRRTGPAFLISLVAWYLLSVLGTQANVEENWGIALPTFCFGIGTVMYAIVTYFIFQEMSPGTKGSPALFLIMTPPSIAVVAWQMMVPNQEGFAVLSKLILGCTLLFFVFLIKIGPHIARPPLFLGYYWAYVFPIAAFSSGTILYAAASPTAATGALAFAFIVIASGALTVVVFRESMHAYLVMVGKACWSDPLAKNTCLP